MTEREMEQQTAGDPQTGTERRLSRREVLQRSAAGALVAGVGPLLASSASAAGVTTSSAKGALTESDIATIKKLIGPIDPRYAGKGMTWKVGAVLPLSGFGAYYGIQEFGTGMNLGVQHIAELGGPNIKITLIDNESGNPTAGINAVLQLHDAGIGAMVSASGADAGAMLPGIAQYKIMSIDQGGGAAPPLNALPYYWGMRGSESSDYFATAFKYVKATMPSARNVTIMNQNFGTITQTSVQGETALAKQNGFNVAGSILPAYGTTDFSAVLAELRAQDPDFIINQTSGLDEPNFMKQYATSGINKPIFSTEWVAATAKVAGSAYNGMYFVQDEFSAATPANPWAKIFVNAYRAKYGQGAIPSGTPDFYNAGYYETMFVFWALFRRVLQKKGNVNSGQALQTAMLANPNFPTVFGGSANAAGIMSFGVVQHGLHSVPIGVYQVKNTVPVLLATANIGGSQFKLGG